MKTLFEKLKPETLRSLEFEASEYPATMELLVDTLKSCNFYGQLSINDAHRLLLATDKNCRFSIEAIDKLFND
jgi:hypothetical protein